MLLLFEFNNNVQRHLQVDKFDNYFVLIHNDFSMVDDSQ